MFPLSVSILLSCYSFIDTSPQPLAARACWLSFQFHRCSFLLLAMAHALYPQQERPLLEMHQGKTTFQQRLKQEQQQERQQRTSRNNSRNDNSRNNSRNDDVTMTEADAWVHAVPADVGMQEEDFGDAAAADAGLQEDGVDADSGLQEDSGDAAGADAGLQEDGGDVADADTGLQKDGVVEDPKAKALAAFRNGEWKVVAVQNGVELAHEELPVYSPYEFVDPVHSNCHSALKRRRAWRFFDNIDIVDKCTLHKMMCKFIDVPGLDSRKATVNFSGGVMVVTVGGLQTFPACLLHAGGHPASFAAVVRAGVLAPLTTLAAGDMRSVIGECAWSTPNQNFAWSYATGMDIGHCLGEPAVGWILQVLYTVEDDDKNDKNVSMTYSVEDDDKDDKSTKSNKDDSKSDKNDSEPALKGSAGVTVCDSAKPILQVFLKLTHFNGFKGKYLCPGIRGCVLLPPLHAEALDGLGGAHLVAARWRGPGDLGVRRYGEPSTKVEK